MILRTLVGAAALTVAISTAAFAAHPVVHKMVAASACTTLENQFTKAAIRHKHSKWLKSAEALDARGTQLCGSGHPIRGAWDLRAALHKIGVNPAV
jgi:hypothetical protein